MSKVKGVVSLAEVSKSMSKAALKAVDAMVDYGFSREEAIRQANACLGGLGDAMAHSCLGHITEVCKEN